MKSISFALAALATGAVASNGYDITSKPFMLLLHSGNATIDGTVLGACHSGAGYNTACVSTERLDDPTAHHTTFVHNVSSDPLFNTNTNGDLPNAIDTPGVLAYEWSGGNFKTSSAMAITQETTSNIGVPYFSPGDRPFTLVEFDEDGALSIPSAVDDTVSPPNRLTEWVKVENWYTCLTYYGTGYVRVTLAWKIGTTGEPQNPTCEKVEVQRVFVGEEAQAIAKMKAKAQH